MDLFLVRHGQPDWAPDRIARNDPGLTETGHAQARRVAHRLSSLDRVDELWVSTMIRADQTADPFIDELGVIKEPFDWLREIQNPPEWDGRPVEHIERGFAEANVREMDEMWDGLPGGESFRDFHTRVVTGFPRDTSDGRGQPSPVHRG